MSVAVDQHVSKHVPEATGQVTDPRTEHSRSQEIGISRNELLFEIPPVYTTGSRVGQSGRGSGLIPRTRHNVQIVCLLQHVQQGINHLWERDFRKAHLMI